MKKPKKNAVEWTVFAASLAVIAVTVVLLLRGSFHSAQLPPDLHITAGTPVRSSGGYAIPITVSNRGDDTAEQARIEVALMTDAREAEKAELTIAFVPGRSRREGWVIFQRDPGCCTLSLRTVSFELP
jgi:uncharacterized protein (TIGR02588 family)